MKNIIFVVVILFFSSLNSMQKLVETPKPQMMDDRLQSEEIFQEEHRYNPIDCGCIEGCATFCFWAGTPICLALIILAKKLLQTSDNDHIEKII